MQTVGGYVQKDVGNIQDQTCAQEHVARAVRGVVVCHLALMATEKCVGNATQIC